MDVVFIGKENYLCDKLKPIKSIPEDALLTSILPFNIFFYLEYKIKKPVESIEEEVEKRLLEDPSIDFESEYEIRYFYYENEDFYIASIFLIEKEFFIKFFHDHFNVKYIDFLTVKPFVFKEVYKEEKFSFDAFLYIGEESFMAFYKDGEYVFTKFVDNLNRLERELDISSEDLENILAKKGLNEDLYKDKAQYEIVDNFFYQFFNKINNIISFVQNSYNLGDIDNIFIVLDYKIASFLEKLTMFFQIFSINIQMLDIEFEELAAKFCCKFYEEDKYNFSIFKRPIPFYKRESIKLLSFFIGLVIVLIILKKVIFYVFISQRNKKIENLKQKLITLKIQKTKLISQSKQLIQLNDKLKKRLSSRIDYLNSLKKDFDKVCKTNLESFLNDYNIILEGLKKYSLNIMYFYFFNKKYTLDIEINSYDSEFVMKFIKYLIEHNFSDPKISKMKKKNNKFFLRVTFVKKN